jgi:imidazolonepropionase-like amidohydrolase
VGLIRTFALTPCLALVTPARHAPATTPQQQATVFTNVHVVTMEGARVLRNQSVLVVGALVRDVADASRLRVPDGARILPSAGLYLIPGLMDMHVHVEDESELRQYLARGFTTLRNMRGEPRHVRWRERIERGELLGPTLVTSGPFVDGAPPYWSGASVVRDAADAERTVAEQSRAGYDFVKVYSLLSSPAYRGVMAAAKRHRMPVAGHVPALVGLAGALGSGQGSTEHLYGYADTVEAEDSPVRGRWAWRRLFGGIPIDAARLDVLAAQMRAAGVWTCPTLALFDRWVPPEARAEWSDAELRALGARTRRAIVKALANAGAGLLFGTDTARIHGMQPGDLTIAELRALVEAGLTPYDAMRGATIDAARFLGREQNLGTIAAGKRADLVLLRGNPLDDVAAVSAIAGVMVRGRWLQARELATAEPR